MSIKIRVKKRLFEDDETGLQDAAQAALLTQTLTTTTLTTGTTLPTTNGTLQQLPQLQTLQPLLQLQPPQLLTLQQLQQTLNVSTNLAAFDPNKFVQETQSYYVELVKSLKVACLPDNILKFIPSYKMLKETEPYKGKEAEFAAAVMKFKDAKPENVQECLQDFTNVLTSMQKYINTISETAKLQAANAGTANTSTMLTA